MFQKEIALLKETELTSADKQKAREDPGLCYMNSYYYIGHLPKFIRPGAKRIISSSTTGKLLTTAFLNRTHLSILQAMGGRCRPQRGFLLLSIVFYRDLAPDGARETLAGNPALAFQRRRRDIFVVKSHENASPVQGRHILCKKLRCALLNLDGKIAVVVLNLTD